MGLFSKLLGGGQDIEDQLEKFYAQFWATMSGSSISEATATVREWIQAAKQASQREGSDKLPPNSGDTLLQRENTDPNIRVMLAQRRQEGVTDADIRWWWNMHDLERRLMLFIDDVSRLGAYNKEVAEGSTSKEAGVKVRKFFPMFGYAGMEPTDISPDVVATYFSGEDRLLPYELKDRVNLWAKHQQADLDAMKKRAEEFSSMNALIRAEMRAGKL